MATLTKEIRIARPAGDVWAVVGDLERISSWVPVFSGAAVEGDTRTCTMRDGATITERILSRDNVARRYEYEVVDSPFGFTSYRASLEVLPEGEDGRVVWTADLEPETMVAELAPLFEESLAGLKQQLEA